MGRTTSGGTAGKDDGEPAVPAEPPFFTVKKHSFTVQFVWQQNRLTARVKEHQLREEEERKALAEAAEAAAAAEPPSSEPAAPAAGDPTGTEQGS